jgi:hypothetical protein
MVSKTKHLLESNRYRLCKTLKTYIDKIPIDNFDEDLFYKEIVQKLLQFDCNTI